MELMAQIVLLTGREALGMHFVYVNSGLSLLLLGWCKCTYERLQKKNEEGREARL